MKKTILITGAGRGLGAAIAMALAKTNDYYLILHYNKSEKDVKKIPAKKIIQADLSKLAGVQQIAKSIDSIDIVINTIGGFVYESLLKMKPTDFTECVENNLFIAWNLARTFIPKMQKKKFGRVVHFGSVGCDQITARPLTTPYYIAKTGLLMMTKTLAAELAGTNVTVNLVTPGVLPTGVRPNAKVPIIPFDAVARAVIFLLADESRFINGANLEVSAGWRPE